jgi:hypothetical protein
MSAKKILIYSALILACIVIVILSVLVSDTLFIGPRRFFAFGFPERFGSPFALFGQHQFGWRGILSAFGAYFFLYLSGLLALFLFPSRYGSMHAALRHSPMEWLRFLVVGGLTGLGLILLTGLGIATSALFPVPLVLITLLMLAVYIGLIVVALAIGAWFNRLAGLLIVFTLGRIPILGWVFTILFGGVALGVIITSRFGHGGAWTLAGVKSISEESL